MDAKAGCQKLSSNIQTQSDGVVASSQGSAGQTSVFRIDLP